MEDDKEDETMEGNHKEDETMEGNHKEDETMEGNHKEDETMEGNHKEDKGNANEDELQQTPMKRMCYVVNT